MGVSERIDTFQRQHRWAAVPVAVGYKFIDDEGVSLAALLSYYGFVSLFPLLLLAVTILGFVLRDDPAAQQAVLPPRCGTCRSSGTSSARTWIPSAAASPRSVSGSWWRSTAPSG